MTDSLGLRRHTVQLVEHDVSWRNSYTLVASEIVSALGETLGGIERVGSTAVRGLPAKPILDVVVGMRDGVSPDVVAERLVACGYIDRGDGAGSIGRLLVRESAPEIRTVHVHVVGYLEEDWRHYVVFRDALLSDSDLRESYAELKRCLAGEYPRDRGAYTKAKAAFVERVLASHNNP